MYSNTRIGYNMVPTLTAVVSADSAVTVCKRKRDRRVRNKVN